ncbi:MAG: hemerythrin family protein [Pseudomonadota bacterium]
MSVIEWSDAALALGVEAMDATHRRMVALMNAAADAGPDAFPAAFEALAEHTAEHFAQEEAWMLECGDPAAAAHRQEHGKLLAEFAFMRGRIAQGRQRFARAFVAERLPEWLPQHASSMDSLLAARLKQQGGAGA